MRPWLLLLTLLSGCATTGARAQNDIGSNNPPENAPANVPGAAPGEPDRAAAQVQLAGGIDKLKAGDAEGARAMLKSFLAQHPEDPSAGVATALLGRLAL